ncbi:Metallo-dependent hydrolase [Aspergillus sclerotioniger CBS 115572]|uniref:adenosine deaminase n=1 Tax=Aspergillus sclerotioniger CBS 115572 TaxID=1450535 RepID=A0A317X8F8_9EURO|nr:Metallo-dependent hydrolase [Aspergillus sclerotioniger CBS 115572]PWY94481.1 Metallo-dependent hydrolase [Aspergillus sclerotioniger CBS 115572]
METNDIEWEAEEGIPHADDPFIQQYLRGRNSLILEEQKQRHDFNLSKALPPLAARACKIVSKIRDRELHQLYSPGSDERNAQLSMGMPIHPGVMSLDWNEVEKTDLWKIVKHMPKGSLLHAPFHAAIKPDFLNELAFSTPGICVYATRPLISQGDLNEAPFFFQYSSASTKDTEARPTIWSASYKLSSLIPISKAASSFPSGGETGFRTWLQSRFHSVAGCSDHHSRAMPLVNSLLSYEPILRACLYHVFSHLVGDGIRYAEFRTTFNFPYRKEGKDIPEDDYSEWCHVFQEELAKFQKTDEGRKLYGARIIWTSLRSLPKREIVESMKNCILAKYDYPDTICGFDIIGDKSNEKPLTDLVPILFWFRKECSAEGLEIPFFFHAGESLKTGGQADQGLFDAILLGSRRICQGLSLCQHPLAIEMVKEKKILIECSPISDEMLGLTDSIQTHPLPALLSRGVPVCLGASALGLSGGRTTGLTRQFWRAVQGLDSMGLTGLAMMVENSIRWSCYQDQPTAEWLSDLREGILGEGTRASRLQEWYADFESFCQWVTVEFAEAEVDEPI